MSDDAERLRAITARYDDGNGEGEALAEQALQRLEWRRKRSGKVCSACEKALPMSAFATDIRESDGLERRCRACEAGRKR